MDERERARVRGIRWVLIWVLGANLAVAAGKALYGYLSGSVAISADAIHSMLDGSSNIIGLVGLHYAGAPADEGHPYGHYKFEIVASAMVGVLILIGGFELGKAAVLSLVAHRPPPTIGVGGFGVVLVTIVVNGLVSRAEHRAGKRLASSFLLADAQHTLSDLMSSCAVLIAFVATKAGARWADAAGAFIVLGFVLRAAWFVLKDNLPILVDAAVVTPEQVLTLARAVPGVRSVHRVRSRGLRGRAHVDLHLLVDPDLSVRSAHVIAHQVEDCVRRGLPEIQDITIHVEPAGDPEEGY